MKPVRFDYGEWVRVVRNVHDDGTYPGASRGDLLVRRGTTGIVRDIGTFLQDQIVYTVHFTEDDRLVGCRDRELIAADAPWVPSRFEFGDKVVATLALGISGKPVAEKGSQGHIIKVLRDAPDGVAYHVRFAGRTLLVPENALDDPPGAPDRHEDASA